MLYAIYNNTEHQTTAVRPTLLRPRRFFSVTGQSIIPIGTSNISPTNSHEATSSAILIMLLLNSSINDELHHQQRSTGRQNSQQADNIVLCLAQDVRSQLVLHDNTTESSVNVIENRKVTSERSKSIILIFLDDRITGFLYLATLHSQHSPAMKTNMQSCSNSNSIIKLS